MTTLSGYHLCETLYQGARTLVYRGTRTCDNQPVVIKFLRNEYPTFSELVQFRNQYTIAKNLDLPGIVKPLSLETHGNGYALVMPDEGSISLGKWQQGQFSMVDFLVIAVQLAEILHSLSQNRVIHKDIKPANILIHPQTKQVKLIDFSISSLLPKETLQISNPNVLEGTLAYISPEQTGRMNRGIDYRSDFYSLGVTFYELLTGELPFQSDDPMELVHCHIAKSPELGNGERGTGNGGEIPQVILDIVLKLMAKNAEDRYQSALGLKYDLEKCLNQLKETGKIESFEIGQRDICDRFTIPEKLYGREAEVEALLAAFVRVASPLENRVAEGNTELMLVAGFSGIGKTAVVNEVHKPIVKQRGYFIKGKFDQFNRNIPFSAFVQAFRNLMGQLLGDNDAQLAVWKTKILEALGENGRVIIEVIPELESIVGKQPEVPELSGSAAQNRFNLLFQKFVQVFAQPEHPLTLFLDDLQWADSASLELLKLLMNEAGYLLILGAYRDNEVSPAHPFMLTVHDIIKSGAIANTITLQALSVEDTNRLIADTLNCDREIARPLTEIVERKTQGNPFFTTQFLKALYQEEAIEFDRERGYWQCDITRVQELALTDDVVEFMAAQLQKLPDSTQNMLKLAACIGSQFDLATLAIVSEQSKIEASSGLWEALAEGLILPQNDVYKFYQDADSIEGLESVTVSYKFLHDRVQQAAYSLIPSDCKQETHLKIGQLLLQNTPETEQEDNIFAIATQLNLGQVLICQEPERIQLAKLNLIAGKKAKSSTAYSASADYLQVARNILTEKSWSTQYQLTLNVYLESIETAYLKTDFKDASNLIKTVFLRVNNFLDRIKAYEIQMQIHIAKLEMQKAIETGLQVLERLDIKLETEIPEEVDFESLANLPKMTDPDKLAGMQILSTLLAPIFIAAPELFPKVGATMTKLSIQYGNSKLSAYGYVLYGWFLCGFLGEIEAGYQFGKVGLKLTTQFQSKNVNCRFYTIFYSFIVPYKTHLNQTLKSLLNAFKNGIEVGELEYSSYSIIDYCLHLFLIGHPLDKVNEACSKFSEELKKNQQNYSTLYLKLWQTISTILAGDRTAISRPDLKILLQEELEIALKNNSVTILFNGYSAKAILAYLLNSNLEAISNIKNALVYQESAAGFVTIPTIYFYYSLALLAADSLQEVENLVAENQQKLQHWAEHAPMNFQHKFDLVEAEKHRVSGNKFEAIELYDRAISGARINGYIQEEALANELAAKFYLDWGFDPSRASGHRSAQPNGKEKVAAGYMQEAYYCYAKWGAKAKTDDLEQRYPNLLKPILQAAAQTLNPIDTLTTLAGFNRSVKTTTQTSHSSTSSINTTLDFAAILKASQALSSTIQLDELLRQLTQIILQNAGGDRCGLILPERDGQWYVAAMATPEATELCSEPLQDNPRLPVRLIQYVKNTQETVVIDDLNTDLPVIDEYLHQWQPKSLLCLPIFDRGNAIGIVYLSNHSTSGAFTHERILVLNFLCTQAAISLENARLYQQAQDYAQQLERSQLQLVQSEKMSALGNLVAGVAHEINNPVGFIGGNLQPARDYVEDLFGLIDLYREKYPDGDEEIEEEIEAIDLDFLREDLPKLLDSMKLGVKRIAHISTSLRTFSRTDREHKVPFNLHDGIDSTLLILKHRLKANEQRPKIGILKHYGNIPDVRCFPGQLNQVFMNLIANAIDALDESNQGRSFEEIAASANQITITTQSTSQEVIIRISDNGVGMPEEVKARIFEQGFTTKGVGKGTGLGMAIVRQIVVEKHDGKLNCRSIPKVGSEFTIEIPR